MNKYVNEYGFVFDENKCTACYGCTVACKSWRNVETGIRKGDTFTTVRYRRIERRWDGAFPGNVSFRTYSVSCQHCVKPWCLAVCPVKAISKADDGTVTVDRAKCIGCRSCLAACPFKVPQFSDKEATAKMQKCDMCVGEIDREKEVPPCVATCNTKAITLKRLTLAEKEANERKLKKLFA